WGGDGAEPRWPCRAARPCPRCPLAAPRAGLEAGAGRVCITRTSSCGTRPAPATLQSEASQLLPTERPPEPGRPSCPPPPPPPQSSPCSRSPLPKLVFNRVNGKRPQVLLSHAPGPEECYTAAHEENVRFVYEAWQEVEQQLDDSQRGESARGPVQYVEKTPNPSLKYFVPIDLEEWWAKQFLAKI
uniref:MAPK regulated corepressor interacting protein 2 n=1 Tax=Anser cygnoides TaxID=8845 RepID=A0A8B9DH90_ANSCY